MQYSFVMHSRAYLDFLYSITRQETKTKLEHNNFDPADQMCYKEQVLVFRQDVWTAASLIPLCFLTFNKQDF